MYERHLISKNREFDNKILLDFLPLKNESMNCYDNNIISDISRYYKKDTRISFLGEFDFSFNPNKENLLDFNDIYNGSMINVPVFLENFFGINIIRNEPLNKIYESFLYSLVKNLNNKNPIGFEMDSYYCPWNNFYMKIHRKHYFLIIGIDSKKDILYCLDSFLSNSVQEISIYTVFEYHKGLIYSNTSECKEIDLKKIIQQIFSYLSLNDKDKNCDKIRSFADIVRNEKYFPEKKLDIASLNKSIFMFRLSDLCWSRKNFGQALSCLYEKFGVDILNEAASNSIIVSRMWDRVKTTIAKGYLKNKGKEHLSMAADIIFEIADYEERILKSLSLII